jgi:hypothetical protein
MGARTKVDHIFFGGAGRKFMDLWQKLAMDSLKFHPGPPCPTLLHPAGGLPAAVFYHCGRAACMQPLDTPLDTPRRTPME